LDVAAAFSAGVLPAACTVMAAAHSAAPPTNDAASADRLLLFMTDSSLMYAIGPSATRQPPLCVDRCRVPPALSAPPSTVANAMLAAAARHRA
jgi:hypothetical protein